MKRQENFLVLVYEVCRLFNLRLLGLTLTARLVFLCLASYLISDKFFILFALSYLRYLNTIRKKGGRTRDFAQKDREGIDSSGSQR